MDPQENQNTNEPKSSAASSVDTGDRAKKVASAYPEYGQTAKEAASSPAPQTAKSQTKSGSKKGVSFTIIIVLVVGVGIGVLLGRTVLKPKPTPEEAAAALFGEAFGELSEQLQNGNFDASDFQIQQQ